MTTVNRYGAISSSRSRHRWASGVAERKFPWESRTTIEGRMAWVRPEISERTAKRVAAARAGATAVKNSTSRSVKSLPARTRPAAPQHTPLEVKRTRSSCCTPSGRHTFLNLALRSWSCSGRSDSRLYDSLRLAIEAKVCGSCGEYSASAKSGSYSCGMRGSPLVMVLITRVSGSIAAQHVSSDFTSWPISSMAAACKSLTPRPEAAKAAMSRRAR
jgi:hypothetical protein